ncbi:hypothetical protein IG631_08380 [Alternaria alternata]|nr:hypothetical protein IG631_08380 [Alternaria alternata]
MKQNISLYVNLLANKVVPHKGQLLEVSGRWETSAGSLYGIPGSIRALTAGVSFLHRLG